MSLSENLQFLRTRSSITPEQLAERLEVSRQSVSKWESGASYPEMDTLLKLCDIFHVDLDTLLRGDASKALAEDGAGYDRFMTRYARQVAGAVAGIICGTAAAALLSALAVHEAIYGAVMLLSITAAVVVLVASGVQYDNFHKRWPTLVDFYSQAERDAFQQKYVWYIAGGVGGILGGLAVVCLGFYFVPEREPYESILGALFLLVLAGSVYTLIYSGMLKDKYDIEKYNHGRSTSPTDRAVSTLWGCAMVGATAVYVGLGLTMELWDRAWVIYPVVVLLCVAVTIYLRRNEND